RENERFGIGVTPLGDLDGDGITDIAVGAYFDGYDHDADYTILYRGAVHVLFLNADGSVKAHTKIGDGMGGFGGAIDLYDEFGVSVAAIGDVDNDGVVDLAVGARLDDDTQAGPDTGLDRGAIWVVFLNSDGTVKGQQKISAYEGGFSAVLADGDWFGSFVTAIGDLDGDAVPDLVAGTPFDDTGGTDQGALYVIFLNSNGTVKSHQKVSGLTGGFTGALEPGDRFGTGPGCIGDLDVDGVPDLAVGALWDDDGGPDLGAVWILFMNSNGTVKSHAKISAASGGFAGALTELGGFGSVCTLLETGNAVHRIAVSAKTDDDGGTNRGAVWLLDVRPDGSVSDFAKISSTAGDFAGQLHDGDEFGLGMASLGDFDGDGNADLAVGARLDNDGPGVDAGAVWLLRLGTCNLVATPAAIDFGNVSTGESADAQFVLKNAGLGTISGSVNEGCGAFSLVAGGGPFTLGPDDSLLVTVRFSPYYAGTSTCTVQTGAACGQIALSGTGVVPPPEPSILSILDIPNDEGRRVRISFAASHKDATGSVEQYEIYRRIDALPNGATVAAPGERRPLLANWDFVKSVPAHGENVYNTLVGTLADSTKNNGMYWSVFLVRATTYNTLTFYDSDPDSGYSLDNIAPVSPSELRVDFGAPGGTVLSWAPSSSSDLFAYKVFRSPAGITPTDRDVVIVTRNTEWTDISRSIGVRYAVASMDSAGNESDPIGPNGETGNLPASLALRQNQPNPFNPTTLIRYDIPAPGARVTLVIYDVQGRLVRTLVDRSEPAGTRSVEWDGRNNAGSRVASGTYFYRLESGGKVLTRKMTLLE
ncbi:MAG TPA: FlgD immunoglobulin-like domain containing protein, partial [Candidatus Krumholzibacteria bacterium]|nr:FlgD immunoglobulin-like domain containing protein [Candidatus Krumholzibacteria bacterium]